MGPFGNFYTVPFSVAASTAGPIDLLTILAPSNSQVQLYELTIGAVSSSATTGINLEVDVYRGSTGASTGAAITPLNLKPQTGTAVAGSSVDGPTTVPISTASAKLLFSNSWPMAYRSFRYRAEDSALALQADISQRMNVRVSTPPLAVTIVGTAVLCEIGRLTNWNLNLAGFFYRLPASDEGPLLLFCRAVSGPYVAQAGSPRSSYALAAGT